MPTKITGTKSGEEVERHKAKIDILMSATPTQIDNFVDNNVTNLAEARTMFKRILKLIRFGLK